MTAAGAFLALALLAAAALLLSMRSIVNAIEARLWRGKKRQLTMDERWRN